MYRRKNTIEWKRFKDNRVKTSKLPVSTSFKKYYPSVCKIVCELQEQGYDMDNTFLICPVYRNKYGFPSDFELGVGGTGKNNEHINTTAFRELGEEVGLIPRFRKKMKDFKFNTDKRNDRTYTSYIIPLKDTKFLNKIQKKNFDEKSNKCKDDSTKKIYCFVFGSENEIKKKLSRKRNINFFGKNLIKGVNSDGIIGFGYKPLSFVLEYCMYEK